MVCAEHFVNWDNHQLITGRVCASGHTDYRRPERPLPWASRINRRILRDVLPNLIEENGAER